jgi:hypothetical protein
MRFSLIHLPFAHRANGSCGFLFNNNIIIIIYFLPIAKDVTNTETTVMYGLRITQTAWIVPIHSFTIYEVGFWGAVCGICCEGVGSQKDAAKSSVYIWGPSTFQSQAG